MPGGADDHLMAPRRVRKPGVDQRETGDVFHLIQQIEATGDRKPAEGQGKEEGQEQRQPEDRDRETDQRDGADQGIGPFIAHYAGDHPHRNAYQQGKAEGEYAQLHGRRENLAQLLRNQLAVNAGDAEIPVQHPFKPEQPRIPQGSALQWGMRGEIAQAETDKGQKKEGDQQQQQTAQGKNNHGFFTSSVFSRDTPANEALPKGLSTRPFIS